MCKALSHEAQGQMATGTPGRLLLQLGFVCLSASNSPSSLWSSTTTTVPRLILKGLTLVTGHAQASTKFLGEMFFPNAQNSFWTHQLWYLSVLLLLFFFFFFSTSSTSANISLWGLFSSQETNKKVNWGKIGWIGRVGHGGHALFG